MGSEGFRAAAERFVETDRHLRRNTAPAVDQIVQRLPGHPQRIRRLGHGKAQRFQTIMPDGKSRMGGDFMRIAQLLQW